MNEPPEQFDERAVGVLSRRIRPPPTNNSSDERVVRLFGADLVRVLRRRLTAAPMFDPVSPVPLLGAGE